MKPEHTQFSIDGSEIWKTQ